MAESSCISLEIGAVLSLFGRKRTTTTFIPVKWGSSVPRIRIYGRYCEILRFLCSARPCAIYSGERLLHRCGCPVRMGARHCLSQGCLPGLADDEGQYRRL